MRPHQQRRACNALILCGGESRRLGGRDKSRMRLRPGLPPQRERLAKMLSPLVRVVYFAGGNRQQRKAKAGTREICARRYLGQGPLEGLAAASRVAGPWWLIIAVDSALENCDFVRRLGRPAGGHSRFAQRRGDHGHSLYLLLPSRDLAAAEPLLRQSNQRVAHFLRTIDACPVPQSHLPPNLNRIEDWRRARWQRRI